MKITMSFNIPEENEEFQIAKDGGKYLAVIEDLDNFLRSKLKYEGDSLTDEQYHVYEAVRDKLRELRYE